MEDSFEELKKQLVTFDVTIVPGHGGEEILFLLVGLEKQKKR